MEIFYKYMSAATARLVLANQTLRWSTPGMLNDPFDMQFDLQYEVDREAVRKLALDKLWEGYNGAPFNTQNPVGIGLSFIRIHRLGLSREQFETDFAAAIQESLGILQKSLPEVNTQTRQQLSVSKILCLTEVPDNPVMWTHYADVHRGVVLRFRDYPQYDSPFRMAEPVQYVAKTPALVDEEFLSDMLAGRASFSSNELLSRLVYTKSAEWAYEREWRLYSGNGRNRDAKFEDLKFGSFELDAVLFGLNTSGDDVAELSELARDLYPRAEILRAARKQRAIGMTFEKMNAADIGR